MKIGGQRCHQKGWITLELLLALVLLSVILFMVERQASQQWQTLQQQVDSQNRLDNQRQRAVMARLTGQDEWLNSTKDKTLTYPKCRICSGNNLAQWFEASLLNTNKVEALEVSLND